MPTKSAVIRQLGEDALLLPELINGALAANDRLKYYLTLLQTAKAHALEPSHPVSRLRLEREAAGVASPAFDDVVASASFTHPSRLNLAGAGSIRSAILDDLEQMLRPLDAAPSRSPVESRPYRERLAVLASVFADWPDDEVPLEAIEAITRIESDRDTVHHLVMDLHREVNLLQVQVTSEPVDGASTWGLGDHERRLVRAFMRGVNETAPLKGSHPGLGSTATLSGTRLTIQNDLGTTDAHVVVIHVDGLSATVTYTDVHCRRAAFFRSLLDGWDVRWQDGTVPAEAAFTMSVGVFAAPDTHTFERYLTRLGSRLVFLIDWNKARKLLSHFIRRSEAEAVLKWSADHNIGHRPLLEADECGLLHTALCRSDRVQLAGGARLDDALGRAAARSLMQSALAIAADGVRAGWSHRLIANQIAAELLSLVPTAERTLLSTASDHAALLTSLADRLRRTAGRCQCTAGQARSSPPAGHERRSIQDAARTAALAKAWETRANVLVEDARQVQSIRSEAAPLRNLLTDADSAADAFERAAFLLTMVADELDPECGDALTGLADLASRGTREYVRALEYARVLPRESRRADVEGVLASIERLTRIGEESDAAARVAEATIVAKCPNFRRLHVECEIIHALNAASRALARCVPAIRDFAFERCGSAHV